jgi:membrane protease YdiL (CAAX protease family)
MKWIAPALAYLAVGLGIFRFHSAWGALVGFHIAIILSLLIARPNIPGVILLKNTKIKWIVLSVLLCGSSGVALYFLWNQFGFADDLPAQVESLGLNSSTWIPFIAYFALVNPFVEEYFWRGYLGSETKKLHVSDFMYSGFHALVMIGKVRMDAVLFGLSMLVLAGWFWRQIVREDHGLLAPVLGHMAADFTILMTVFNMTG